MEIILSRIIESLLLPPGLNIIMMFIGVFIISRWYRTGLLFMLGGYFSLIIFSLPITAHLLDIPNNDIKPIAQNQLTHSTAQAIIVLGGGRYRNAPEYQQDTVSTATLARLRYAAYLHKKSAIPILTTGGIVYEGGISEAELMQNTLQFDFNVQTKWLETSSRNTKENAEFSYKLLQKDQINTIILVTHVSHIKRAKNIFTKVGFNVISAPMSFNTRFENIPLILSLIPTAAGLGKTKSLLREYMGQLWYLLRY